MQVNEIARILNAEPKGNVGSWIAACPVCGAALLVAMGRSRVVLDCARGCTTGPICKAIGLRSVDLFTYSLRRLPRK